MKRQPSHFSSLSKTELRQLVETLGLDEPADLARCVAFVCAETIGHWHGRARAKMCRHFKHVSLSREQSAQLVDSILNRLTQGNFAEQFKDQLRLVRRLDPEALFAAARQSQTSVRAHVRRYADWILQHRAQ